MIRWIPPQLCTPPHKVARPDQVVDLANAFVREGWNPNEPALIGYPFEGGVQLLSGSHRWAASMLAKLDKIPVEIKPLSEIEQSWGTDRWSEVMSPKAAGASDGV